MLTGVTSLGLVLETQGLCEVASVKRKTEAIREKSAAALQQLVFGKNFVCLLCLPGYHLATYKVYIYISHFIRYSYSTYLLVCSFSCVRICARL